MRRLIFVWILFSTLLCVGWQKPDQLDARALFEQSYRLATDQLDHTRRAYHLLFLTTKSVHIVPDQEIERWCSEMFRLASAVPSGWDRVALQKNALLPLAEVNPVLAMRMFRQVADPQPDWDGTFPEDVRANAARPIFGAYWRASGTQGLPEIQSQARHIGDTGEFPYGAIGYVANELAKSGADQGKTIADNMLREALEYYKRGSSKFQNRDREFLRLLDGASPTAKDTGVFADALHVFVDKVEGTPNVVDYSAKFTTSAGDTVEFDNRNLALLFRAFPLIRKVDPKWAIELIGRHPELKKADEHMEYNSAGVVPWATTAEESRLLHNKMLQYSLLSRIKNLAPTDLARAKLLADKLSDDSVHIEGFSSLIPALMASDPEEANRVYASERTRLLEVKDDHDKFRSLVALAEAANRVKDADGFDVLAASAFDHGMRLFDDDSRLRPQLRVDQRRGYDQMAELVEFGAAHGLDWMLKRIEGVNDAELKANLLIYAARGVANSAASSKTH